MSLEDQRSLLLPAPGCSKVFPTAAKCAASSLYPCRVQTRVVLVNGDVIFPPRLVPKYDRFDGVSLSAHTLMSDQVDRTAPLYTEHTDFWRRLISVSGFFIFQLRLPRDSRTALTDKTDAVEMSTRYRSARKKQRGAHVAKAHHHVGSGCRYQRSTSSSLRSEARAVTDRRSATNA